MKYYLFFILFIFTHKVAPAANKSDSVLFSQNGQFVLLKNGDIIKGCISEVWLFYQWDKEENPFYVTFFNDSVYFLSYADSFKLMPLFPCGGSNIRIVKKVSKSAYTIKYNFAPASHITFQSMMFKTDTISSYYNPIFESGKGTKYYDIKILLYMADQLLFTDTVSTNYLEIDFAKYSSNYTVYFSLDRKYYFINGFYYYGLRNSDNSYSKTRILTRKIRKNN